MILSPKGSSLSRPKIIAITDTAIKKIVSGRGFTSQWSASLQITNFGHQGALVERLQIPRNVVVSAGSRPGLQRGSSAFSFLIDTDTDTLYGVVAEMLPMLVWEVKFRSGNRK